MLVTVMRWQKQLMQQPDNEEDDTLKTITQWPQHSNTGGSRALTLCVMTEALGLQECCMAANSGQTPTIVLGSAAAAPDGAVPAARTVNASSSTRTLALRSANVQQHVVICSCSICCFCDGLAVAGACGERLKVW